MREIPRVKIQKFGAEGVDARKIWRRPTIKSSIILEVGKTIIECFIYILTGNTSFAKLLKGTILLIFVYSIHNKSINS
jgi:hypothetical protein